MKRQDALQGALDVLILKTLARRPGLHGYLLMSAIQGQSNHVLRVEEGSLYPALHRLEEVGWIRARWTTTERGRRVRVYDLTPSGRRQVTAEEARWRAVTAAVSRVLRTV
jgi:PadR family transcriptional regulator PadR